MAWNSDCCDGCEQPMTAIGEWKKNVGWICESCIRRKIKAKQAKKAKKRVEPKLHP